MVPILSSQPLWHQCCSFAESRAGMGAGTCAAELSWWQIFALPLLSFLLFHQKDRIRALEITIGCKLALESLCKPSGVPSYNRQNFHPKDLNLDHEVLYRCLILYLCTQYFFLHLETIYWHVYSYIFQQGIFSCNRICFILMDIWCVAFLLVRNCKNQTGGGGRKLYLTGSCFLIYIMQFSSLFLLHKCVEFQRVQFQLNATTLL